MIKTKFLFTLWILMLIHVYLTWYGLKRIHEENLKTYQSGGNWIGGKNHSLGLIDTGHIGLQPI